MTIELWLIVMLILSVGIFVQAAAGFAAGMLIIPILLWYGYSMPAAQAALLVATVPQNIWGVWSLRADIDTKSVIGPALARVLFFPLGLLVLSMLESFPSEVLKQIVSGFILVATLITIFVKPTPRQRVATGWSVITFPISGFLQGLVGMGGPVLVLWVQAHGWSAKRSRGFLFAMYLFSIIPALAILWWSFGDRIVDPAVVAALSIPGLGLATYLGLRVGNWLGRERLRRVTLALLMVIGIVGLLSPWLT